VQIDFDGGIAVAVHARHRTPDQRSGP
jgi:hypothetical protein